MTTMRNGFFIERISIFGTGLPTADVVFRDGLNVIAGASDTGKSYLGNLIDFAFGASRPPRVIGAAKGYDRLVARLQDRASGNIHEIERSLGGGDVILRRVDAQGRMIEERHAAVKHQHDNNTTLSAFLLRLSGFSTAKVRKNKNGEMRTLSFRDIAFLTVVDETRIISENPPHISGSYTEATAEGEVLRLVVSGQQAVTPIVAPKKTTATAAKAQVEVVQQLASQVSAELAALKLEPEAVETELEQIDAARAEMLMSYESTRVELVGLESELSERVRSLHDAESRLMVIEGLVARFKLLDRHYASDIERLAAVREAGSMLESLPTKICPVCGAVPEMHRTEEVAAHFGLENVRTAATREIEKTQSLRADLSKMLSELATESKEREAVRERLRSEISGLQARITNEIQPRVRATAEQLRQQDGRRDTILRARILIEQLNDLNERAAKLEVASKRGKVGTSEVETGVRTAEMETFAREVQGVLAAWNYPELGRVVFSDKSQDLVIGNQERSSHGKGVRALTCAAFIAGLMRHCVAHELPHPGIIVLDSPLVAYKDPDKPDSESARLRQAGVKDAFYRSLASGLCHGQVIVLENEDPPADLAVRIMHHHFTKSSTGRYGLFAVRA